jgi:hypothetical protein
MSTVSPRRSWIGSRVMRNRRVDSSLHTASRRIIDLLRSRGNRYARDREKPPLETGSTAGQAHQSAVRADSPRTFHGPIDLQSQVGRDRGGSRGKRAIPARRVSWTTTRCLPIRRIVRNTPRSQASAWRAVGTAPVMERSCTPISTAATTFCAKVAPTREQVGRGVAGAAVRPRRLALSNG